MRSKEHWEALYSSKRIDALSWFQPHATSSLRLIQRVCPDRKAAVIDVGGGASTLVDDLVAQGYADVSVLDLSGAALARARDRLGPRASGVQWIEADITAASLPAARYDLWHDRAVFHFLTDRAEREAYVRAALAAVKPGGAVIVAAFSEDGPTRCSGLPVVRYGADELHSEFGEAFALLHHEHEEHRTPTGTVQQFVYCLCRRG